MTLGLAFWILMIVWAIFGFVTRSNSNPQLTLVGNSLLIFILFVLLGWAEFGAPLHK